MCTNMYDFRVIDKTEYKCGDKLPKGGSTTQTDLGNWMKEETAKNACYCGKE